MRSGRIDHKKAARDIIAGKPITPSLAAAGYDPDTSRQALHTLVFQSTPLREAFISELGKWKELQSALPTSGDRATLARLRLVMNVIAGKDQAVQSIKLMGQDREVNMFEPESVIGIQIAVNPPSNLRSEFLEHEDPPPSPPISPPGSPKE